MPQQQQHQLDLFSALEQRDAALAQVASNAGSWFERALQAISYAPLPPEFTGEDMRDVIASFVGMPHHHNTWGALTAQACRSGLIRPTGEWRRMTGDKSHARRTPVYVRV